jgi:replicative DNA helicase
MPNFSVEDVQRIMANPMAIRNMSVVAHVDHGKCVAVGTQIMMSDLSRKPVERIKVNDSLLGLDGLPKKVIEVHNGVGQLYKISQANGNSYVTNGEHILVLKFADTDSISLNPSKGCYTVRYIYNLMYMKKDFSTSIEADTFLMNMKESNDGHYMQKGDIIEISVNNYLNLQSNVKEVLYGFKQGVDLPYNNVSLDPYMLGLWLADGWHSRPSINNISKESIRYMKEYCKISKQVVDTEVKGNITTYHMCAKNAKNGHVFLYGLHDYGLVRDKRIPMEYLNNSREVRLALLAGLTDTSGCLCDNVCEINQMILPRVLFFYAVHWDSLHNQ